MSYQSHKNATVYFLISISLISFDILRISNPVTIVTTIITIPAIDKYNSMLIFPPYYYFFFVDFFPHTFCFYIFSMPNFSGICKSTQKKLAGKNLPALNTLFISLISNLSNLLRYFFNVFFCFFSFVYVYVRRMLYWQIPYAVMFCRKIFKPAPAL